MTRTGMEREEALKHAMHTATASMVFDLNELEDASDTAACDNEIRMPEVLVQQESYTTRDSIVFTPSPSDIRLSAYVGAGSVVEQRVSNPQQVTPPTAMLSYQQQYVPNPIPPPIPVIPTLPYRAATPEVPVVEPAPRRKRAEAGGGGGTVNESGKDPAQLARRNERERAVRAQESDATKRERREKRRLADAHRQQNEDTLAHRKKSRRENDSRRRERKTEAERVEYNERRRELHRIRKEKKENGTFSAPRIASASASSSSSSPSTFSFSSSPSSSPPGAFISIAVPFELGDPL